MTQWEKWTTGHLEDGDADSSMNEEDLVRMKMENKAYIGDHGECRLVQIVMLLHRMDADVAQSC